MHCSDPAQLCDACLARELVRVRPIAESIGERLADTLAGALVPHPGWVDLIDRDSEVIRRRIDELARDPRLRDELAKIVVTAMRRRLGL